MKRDHEKPAHRMFKMAVRRVKQIEVEVKVERSRLLQSQPWPEPELFRKPVDFFNILLILAQ